LTEFQLESVSPSLESAAFSVDLVCVTGHSSEGSTVYQRKQGQIIISPPQSSVCSQLPSDWAVTITNESTDQLNITGTFNWCAADASGKCPIPNPSPTPSGPPTKWIIIGVASGVAALLVILVVVALLFRRFRHHHHYEIVQ
jgi:hypothetical protein